MDQSPFNRLTSANQNGPNSFIATFTGNNPGNPQNNNRLDGYSYDAAGNLLSDKTHTYTYDAENHLIQVDGGATATYAYDAYGRRVYRTGYKDDPACDSNGLRGYVYDLSDRMISEVISAGRACNFEVYAGGRHLSSERQGAYFSHTDWLGTERVRISYVYAAQRQYDQHCASLPFGDGMSPCDGNWSSTLHFTGKERDIETGLNNFGARYNSSSMGRFMSVDPIWVKADRMLDPQRLNLYAYGRNNPLKFEDPTGMDVVLGKCAGGDVNKCFAILQQGLRKEDRSHVHLVAGDGKNGFQKGVFGVTVDADYKSTSGNFQNLQQAANDHSATGRIDVLKSGDTYKVFGEVSYSKETGSKTGVSTATFRDDFEGYTLFPYRGRFEPGVSYTDGDYSEAIVNGDSTADEMAVSMHHELRHIVLGDFGRSATKALHSQPRQPKNDADRQTDAAGREALENAKQP
jgi:RHS repeat-associated protein